MTKTELAQWLARVSWRNGKNTTHGDSYEAWIAYYLTFSKQELASEYQSYGC